MLYFKKNQEVHKVHEEDIMYIHQDKRDVIFVTDKGEFYWRGKKIKDIEKFFSDSFIKCHSYLLVNLDKIAIVKNVEVILDNNVVVGMCKAATNKVRKRLMKENEKFKAKNMDE